MLSSAASASLGLAVGGGVANIQVGSDIASGHGTVTSDVSNGGLGFRLP